MRRRFRFFLQILFLSLLFFSFSDLFSQQTPEEFWIQEGEILLENKKYSEAKDLAESVLSQNPIESRAEFLLTRAWMGLGKEEIQKGNRKAAKEYLEKAYKNWPLNEGLRKELSDLQSPVNVTERKNVPARVYSPPAYPEFKESLDSLREEIRQWRTEISDWRKDSETSDFQRSIFYALLAQLVLQILGFYWIRGRKS